MQQTDDLRIEKIYEAEPPAAVHERHPITERGGTNGIRDTRGHSPHSQPARTTACWW